MQKILALVLLALHGTATAPVSGSYIARTMNGNALPAELRVPATAGAFHLFRLEQGVLRLSEGRRFTLYFRYYHQLVERGHHPAPTPVLSDSETGTFRIEADKITLTPTKKNGAAKRSPFVATIEGDAIKASYRLENGGSPQQVSLTLRRDPSFW